MRNNKTTGNAPLRVSETQEVLLQQILGNITREGAGPFENVNEAPAEKKVAAKKTRKKK